MANSSSLYIPLIQKCISGFFISENRRIMANQFKPVIDKLKDQSDKDGSKALLYQEYKEYTAPQLTALRDEYVKELIHQLMEYKEKAEYLYLHHFNEN